MPQLLETIWAWLHTPQGRKIFRYTMTSVISTAVSLFVLGIVFGVLRLWTEVPSTIFANVVAAFPSYWLNRRWAWGKSGRSRLVKEVLPFWVMSIASIAFSMVGASVARYLGQRWDLAAHHHLELTALVLFANVMSFGIFWVLKLMVFNRTFKVPTLADEIAEHLEAERTEGGTAVRPDDDTAVVR
ncbi:MAG TPA: GtrA family protein [Acidimicrobiales bacterium]|nr:GtrA family protein [Acidimicrobiales bacterium]